MATLIKLIYDVIFKYFCIPVFILMLVGKPRFLITGIRKLINIREPYFQIKIFRGASVVCLLVVLWNYYIKWSLEKFVDEETKNKSRDSNINYTTIDDKLKDAHLSERNAYMFFTFLILMVIVERFCHTYLKLWKLQDELKNPQMILLKNEPVKNPVLKKKE